VDVVIDRTPIDEVIKYNIKTTITHNKQYIYCPRAKGLLSHTIQRYPCCPTGKSLLSSVFSVLKLQIASHYPITQPSIIFVARTGLRTMLIADLLS